MWFGHGQARCFGMLHQPETASKRGVIFCNALGYEGLLAYRAFRHVADHLSERGFWALRFDYDGECDSAGGPWEPGRVEAWLASIDAAVEVLRSRGVTDVRLVGFRMGASLAYIHAATHPGISSAVLWSPCVAGPAYVRELRALSRLSGVARPAQRISADWFPDDALEVAGFEYSGETLRDMAGMDLLTAPVTVCPPSVLVIDRDDAPHEDALVQRLTDSGAAVDHEHLAGYEEFVTDGEEFSIIPWPVLRRIEEWLVALPAAEQSAAVPEGLPVVERGVLTIAEPAAERLVPVGPTSDRVVEEPIWVDDRFFAVCSRPAGDAPIRRTAIVLSNTGSNNRIGPGRLYVNLARYWAGLGFTVVRVDLGGAGDSLYVDPPTENLPMAPVRIGELRDILTWVKQWTGFEHVVTSGLCSGAFNAFQVAVEGLHIDHLILINPGIFYLGAGQSLEDSDERALHSAYALARGVTSGRKLRVALTDREVLRRGLKSARYLFGASAMSGYRVLVAASLRNTARRFGLPVRASSELARDLEEMIARGVKVFIVFAADESSERYLRTFGGRDCAALEKQGGLEIISFDGGDHIFSPPGSRQLMIEKVTTYLEREYPLPNEPRYAEEATRT
jgi:dienelactone hydrolase